MAKDLPYFKFFSSEWTDGDITLESYEVQGLFINICAYYWSKECKVNINTLKKRFKDQHSKIQDLINEGFIKVKNDAIFINFLDEQANDRKTLSKTNSANARKRWGKMRPQSERNATASNSQCENHAIKKREEKKREDNIGDKFNIFWSLYPKKVQKEKCKQKFLKLKPGELKQISKTLKNFLEYKPFEDYTHPNPLTYLNQKRWEDVLQPSVSKKQAVKLKAGDPTTW